MTTITIPPVVIDDGQGHQFTLALTATLTPVTVAVPPVTAVVTESASGTLVPPAASLIDAHHDAWTKVGAQVARNGVVDKTTGGLVELLYWNHEVWQHVTAPAGVSAWWVWRGGWWQDGKADPRPGLPGQADLTIRGNPLSTLVV